MSNNKIKFNVKVIEEIVNETIKKIPLIDFSITPSIEIDPNNRIIDIKIAVQKNSYSVFTCLSEVQDLVYYELKGMLDNSNIVVNVGTL